GGVSGYDAERARRHARSVGTAGIDRPARGGPNDTDRTRRAVAQGTPGRECDVAAFCDGGRVRTYRDLHEGGLRGNHHHDRRVRLVMPLTLADNAIIASG